MTKEINIQILDDIKSLKETNQVEIKLALGKDGKGELPKDFWSTYSAMANTKGGWVILGIKENNNKFSLVGLENIEKIKKDLFTMQNNIQKISHPLLVDHNVIEKEIDGKTILIIEIPEADKSLKPIYINGNPNNSYHRVNDSDLVCDSRKIQQMISEKSSLRDAKVYPEYTFDDIDLDSLNRYRNLLSANNPTHRFLHYEKQDFLQKIGGWGTDRKNKTEGITLAGLLMFGKYDALKEMLPTLSLDYQEKTNLSDNTRWDDRIYNDGTWSGNLFDFYHLVYPKLISNLKIPFQIKNGVRKNDTEIHQAIREALINTLVHADYLHGNIPTLVLKMPDKFSFRNPGLMLISIEDAINGTFSVCRNPTIHQMFLHIGLSEKAGSGVKNIFRGWGHANWQKPILKDINEMNFEYTLLELSTVSLIPKDILDSINSSFGEDKFKKLNEFHQMILSTTAQEGWINHKRVCELTSKHSRDVTLALSNLVKKGFLISEGNAKSKRYKLSIDIKDKELSLEKILANLIDNSALSNISQTVKILSNLNVKINHEIKTPIDNFTKISAPFYEALKNLEKFQTIYNAMDIKLKSGLISDKSGLINNNLTNSTGADLFGRFIDPDLDKPIIKSLNKLDEEFLNYLKKIALPTNKSRIRPEVMDAVLTNLCDGNYVSLSALASLVNRNPDSLRKNYIKRLVQNNILSLAYPENKNSPNQAYTSVNFDLNTE